MDGYVAVGDVAVGDDSGVDVVDRVGGTIKDAVSEYAAKRALIAAGKDPSALSYEAGMGQVAAATTPEARAAGYENYVSVGWEEDRVAILRSIEEDAFFQQIRGGLVTGLYNQKEVWPIFGYEGASFEYGGYIDRGFNDINWL